MVSNQFTNRLRRKELDFAAVDALAMIVPATVKKVSVKVGIWRQEKRAAGFWIQFEQVSPRAR